METLSKLIIGVTILFILGFTSLPTSAIFWAGIIFFIFWGFKNRQKLRNHYPSGHNDSTSNNSKSKGKNIFGSGKFTDRNKKYGSSRNPPTSSQLNALDRLGYKGKTPLSSAEADRLIKKGYRRR